MAKPKRKPLSQALTGEPAEAQAPAPRSTPAAPEPVKEQTRSVPSKRTPGREGKANISGWFPKAVQFELEELRMERSRALGRKVSLQELMGEAYNDLFKKYGRPELVPLKDE